MLSQNGFGPLQIAIIGLTVATAIIHLSLLFPETIFILNAAGYLVLLLLLYLPVPQLDPARNWIRWVLITYTLITIGLWISFGARDLRGYSAKAIEVLLVLLLWFDAQRSES